jgi:hypothetical protein
VMLSASVSTTAFGGLTNQQSKFQRGWMHILSSILRLMPIVRLSHNQLLLVERIESLTEASIWPYNQTNGHGIGRFNVGYIAE